MTIDEAIAKARKIADSEGGTEYGEKHRRLAELLEGLRKYEETVEDHTITLDKSKAFEFHVDPEPCEVPCPLDGFPTSCQYLWTEKCPHWHPRKPPREV